MWRKAWGTVAVAAATALVLAGCGGGGEPVGGDSSPARTSAAAATTQAEPTQAEPTEAATTTEPADDTTTAAATDTGSAVPVDADPCALVTQDEASTLLGAAAGVTATQDTDGGGKICVYSAGAQGTVSVLVGQTVSSGDANATWDEEQKRAQENLAKSLPEGVTLDYDVQDLSGLGDRATLATGTASFSGVSISSSSVYVLKGATFLSISALSLGGTAPSTDALTAQAGTAVGRL